MAGKKSIGIFDSGLGGLDVMRGILEEMPDYDFIYLGDTKRVPYGNRSKKEIYSFCRQAVDFLFEKKCVLVIFACNTASSGALRRIQREYLPGKYPDKKVLGVLVPAAEAASRKTKNGKIGVIGTKRTIQSGAFKRELTKENSKIEIFQKACPLLAEIVERGEENSQKTENILKEYLKPLIRKNIDTLILGCTHYGILEPKIKGIAGKNIKIVNESKIIAGKLKNYLRCHPEIEKNLGKNKKRRFFITGEIRKFEALGSRFFWEKIKVKKVRLGKMRAS